jgi:hypothetical protein
VSGNLAGRPPQKPGEKRPHRKKIELVITPGGGDVDELDLLSAIVSHPDIDVRTRMGAASALARYRHPPAPRKISKPVDIPASETVEQATLSIGKIASLAAAGEIGLDEGGDLVKFFEAFITARTEQDLEARLRLVEDLLERDPPPAMVEVSGGLPPLSRSPEDPWPGVTMPNRTLPAQPDKDHKP